MKAILQVAIAGLVGGVALWGLIEGVAYYICGPKRKRVLK